MQQHIVKLHKKYKNVVNLKNARVLPVSDTNFVDLRTKTDTYKRSTPSFRERVETLDKTHHISQELQAKKSLYGAGLKVLAILLIVSLNSVALSSIGSTFSVFNDTEASTDNAFIAGLLDFELTLSPFSNDAWANLTPGTTTAQDIDVEPNTLSNPFFYYASSTNLTGDTAFCDAIQIVATLNGEVMYQGLLSGLVSSATSSIAAWNIEFSNNQNFFNSVCHFDIDFNGWQTRHEYPNYHDGFSDTERTSHTLYSDGLKINKIYFEEEGGEQSCLCGDPHHDEYGDDDEYHCDNKNGGSITIINTNSSTVINNATTTSSTGGNTASGGSTITTGNASSTTTITNTVNQTTITVGGKKQAKDYEWVEIYNPNSEPADIDGWFLCDGQSCDTLSAPGPIPPLGFALVAANSAVWNKWAVPDEFVTIVVDDGAIGDGLDNENDVLTLRRPDNAVFDAVNWGTPDPLWPYYIPTLWNPGVPAANPGDALSRVPTGVDTNTKEDFTSLTPPSVDMLYPGQYVPHPWYWRYTYLVTWEAMNNNGDDSELLIDIVLIQDTNYNHKPDKHDNRVTLASKTQNDGNEEVTVPEGFIGYVWVALIAVGPENPMMRTWDKSGKIYDPIPQHLLNTNDEEEKEFVQEAITRQLVTSGESEYKQMLITPVEAEKIEDGQSPSLDVVSSTTATTTTVGTTTATSTQEQNTDEENETDEEQDLATKFNGAVEKRLNELLNETQQEEDTATSTEQEVENEEEQEDVGGEAQEGEKEPVEDSPLEEATKEETDTEEVINGEGYEE